MLKLGILISGGGTTMQAVINECMKGSLKNIINPVMVIASCQCAGIVKAKNLSVPTFLLERKKYPKGERGQQEYGFALLSLLKKSKVDIITQNGWLPLTSKNVIKAYKNRIFNQHPGPLDPPYPDFGGKGMFGLRIHAAVLYFSKKIRRCFATEATVQRVDTSFDRGEILLRQPVKIKVTDTPETLAKRVLPFEHQLQIKLLKLYAAKKLKIYKRRNRLIKENEVGILQKAKEKAARDYPKVNMPKDKKVLIIGNGGREHAIGWKISQSPEVSQIFFAPGNGGTHNLGENIPFKVTEIEKLLKFAQDKKIDLTIVGSEIPLSLGIVDRFEAENLPIFGPTQKAAEIECSKVWSRIFLQKIGIPGPEFTIFDNPSKAIAYVSLACPCVVKADKLAFGKGAVVCQNPQEAKEAIRKIMVDKVFGDAGEKIVVEEFLKGQEVSVIALCDGENYRFLVPAKDYKKAKDDDKGLNTGGMGAIAPATFLTPKQLDLIGFKIFQPVLSGLRKIGRQYKGVLYAGLILTDNGGIKVLEFNCRFGDPETQVQLPLLKNDLYAVIEACIFGGLKDEVLEFNGKSAVCVVLASKGYPQDYKIDKEIKGLNKNPLENLLVFHAGTKRKGNLLKTSGGRVLNIVAVSDSVKVCREKAYQLINNPVSFEGMYYRKDIGII